MGRRRSRRALEVAFDGGITYFDVARSYGFGAAESLLGTFLRGKRDQVCLASKFGIVPVRRAAMLDRLRPMIRPAFQALRRMAPATDQKLRQTVGGALASFNQFSPDAARQSLEQSLRDLRTDHLDIWLLHECAPDVARSDELFTLLDQSIASGKVRYYGAASGRDDVAAVLRARPGARIAQFAANAADDSIHRLENPRGVAVNTHSPFARGALSHALSTFLAADLSSARRWSTMLDLDLLSPAGINEFLLRFSMVSNRTGIVICSMFSPHHIRFNIGVAGRAAQSKYVEEVAAEMRHRNAFAS